MRTRRDGGARGLLLPRGPRPGSAAGNTVPHQADDDQGEAHEHRAWHAEDTGDLARLRDARLSAHCCPADDVAGAWPDGRGSDGHEDRRLKQTPVDVKHWSTLVNRM